MSRNPRRNSSAAVWLACLAAVCCVGLAGSVRGQDIQFENGPARPRASHVSLLTDALQLTAGQMQEAELRFRVEPGFHINSHHPGNEWLIPTVLTLHQADGVRAADPTYPPGTAFQLHVAGDSSPGETLDVYQGEFRVKLRLAPRRGETTVLGELKYQACDSSACFPPRTLSVKVLVTGK